MIDLFIILYLVVSCVSVGYYVYYESLNDSSIDSVTIGFGMIFGPLMFPILLFVAICWLLGEFMIIMGIYIDQLRSKK